MPARTPTERLLNRLGHALRPYLSEDSELKYLLRRARSRLPGGRPPGRLPRIVQVFAKAYPQARFIQVGSNDGVQLDPLRVNILKGGWSGIMIEPVPYVFQRLQRNYGQLSNVTLENLAIADRDGSLPFYYLAKATDRTGLPKWYDALGSFRKEVILSHRDSIPDIEQRLTCENVPCATFDSLCAKHGITHLDLIHIDTEGYDYEIIKRIDFDRLRPRLLIFECKHLGDAKAECYDYLERQGFALIEEGLDAIALNLRGTGRQDQRLIREWNRLSGQEPLRTCP